MANTVFIFLLLARMKDFSLRMGLIKNTIF